MKKLVFLASAILAAMAASCSQEGVKYVVKGTGPEDGVLVRLIDRLSDTPIDSAVVKGGVFQMKGRTAENAFLGVKADGSGWSSLMINDGVPVQVSLADSTLTGSDNNTRLTEYDLNTSRALNAVNAVITEISNLPEEEQAARMPAYFKAMENLNSSYLSIFEENKDNYIPVAFLNMIPDLFGPEKLNELMESGAVFANHPYAQELKRKQDEAAAKRKAAEEKKKAIVGQKFLDLEEADTDGNMHKLSEYVGQGKWVLVDFWASWCGPCKAERPNVVAAYKKYHKKGFDIVGLSFDREKEPWVKAISEWEMPWIHLSDLKYWKSVASDVYSVNSIPDNLLIDPEGTVVARGLRGAALEAKLAEVIK